MIPWFIVTLIDLIVRPFGYDAFVTATSGNWGADRVHFVKRGPGVPRPHKLKPYLGGPLTEAPFEGDAVKLDAEWAATGRTDRRPTARCI